MSIFQCCNNTSFLQTISNWILNYYKNNQNELDIIVQDNVAANAIKNQLVQLSKQDAITLPNIFPIKEIQIVNHRIILSYKYENTTQKENQLIIANQIHKLTKKKVSLKTAILISQQILPILQDFHKAKQKVEKINQLFYDFPEHSNFLKSMLVKINHTWLREIKKHNKKESTTNLIKQIELLKLSIQKNLYKKKLLIIGLTDEFLHDILSVINTSQIHHYILPPHPNKEIASNNYIKKVLKNSSIEQKNIKKIEQNYFKSIINVKYQYLEFDSYTQEKNYIIASIKKFIANDTKKK